METFPMLIVYDSQVNMSLNFATKHFAESCKKSDTVALLSVLMAELLWTLSKYFLTDEFWSL